MIERMVEEKKKEQPVNTNDNIKLDKETMGDLQRIMKSAQELQFRMELIMKTYLNARGKKGNYRLSKDFEYLEKVEEKQDGNTV